MGAIRLELFAEQHLGSLGSLLADPETHRLTRVPVPAPPDFARIWLGRYVEGRRDVTREAFAVVDAEDGAVLGLVMSPRIDRDTRTAELGYALAPEACGRGAATEALRQLTEWAFAAGMLRLELLISVDNESSKRVAERCGYVFEGVLRSAHFKADLRADTEIWSRLPTDRGRASMPGRKLRGAVSSASKAPRGLLGFRASRRLSSFRGRHARQAIRAGPGSPNTSWTTWSPSCSQSR